MADQRYRVGVGGVPKDNLAKRLTESIKALEKVFPDASIALFVFDKPPRTGMAYIASANREDVATAVGEWAARVNPKRN